LTNYTKTWRNVAIIMLDMLAHVVVMQNVTVEKIDAFVRDLQQQDSHWGISLGGSREEMYQ
jgi:hypothetical protein